jgi:hypothetical protein
MPPLSAIERGRRVAHQRLSSQDEVANESFIIEPVTPETSHFCVKALESEIDTLHCILRSKEKEMEVLRTQLSESNKIIEKTRDIIENLPLEKKPTHAPGSTSLLKSFSDASVASLQRVCGAIESRTRATDIHSLEKRIDELVDFETKYNQIYRASCLYLRLRPGDVSHSALVHLLKSQGKQTIVDNQAVLKDATKKPSGISWTFR